MGEEPEAQRGCNMTKVSPRIRSLFSGSPNILFTPPLTSKATYSLYHMLYHLTICSHAMVNHSLITELTLRGGTLLFFKVTFHF